MSDSLREMTEQFSQKFEQDSGEQQPQEPTQTQEQEENLPDNSSLNTEPEASQSQSEESQEEVRQPEQEAQGQPEATEQREETNDSEQEVVQSSESQEEEETFTPDEFVEYVTNNIGDDEEIRQALLEKLNITPQSYASEEVEKINQFVKETGRSVEDYYFVNNTLDVDGMNAETAVKAQLALDNPDLTTEEVNDLFEGKYKLDEDEYSEREIKASKAMLKADGNKALRSLNELKEKYKSPVKQESKQSQSSLVPEGFEQQFNESLSSLESFEFDLGDGNTYTHKLDEGNLSSIKFNPNDPMARWRNNDGSIDANAMTDELALLSNLDNIVQGAVKQAVYNTREQDVKSKKNVDLPQQRQPEANKPPQNDFQKDAEMVKNRLLGKR